MDIKIHPVFRYPFFSTASTVSLGMMYPLAG